MRTEDCCQCGSPAEPPFEAMVAWQAPASVEQISAFMDGEECDAVSIRQPLCRYCAYALSHGADGLTEDGKDALDISDES